MTLFDASDASDAWTAYALENGATHVKLDKGLVMSARKRAVGVDVLVFADLGRGAARRSPRGRCPAMDRF